MGIRWNGWWINCWIAPLILHVAIVDATTVASIFSSLHRHDVLLWKLFQQLLDRCMIRKKLTNIAIWSVMAFVQVQILSPYTEAILIDIVTLNLCRTPSVDFSVRRRVCRINKARVRRWNSKVIAFVLDSCVFFCSARKTWAFAVEVHICCSISINDANEWRLDQWHITEERPLIHQRSSFGKSHQTDLLNIREARSKLPARLE
mmetsp:Transcript_118856/g.186500  ORF Transcript_118856/g.186500 Transcript_118856/m.186500 type:complete len:204 (+) Transcript_118856:532-1143(+)